MSKFELDEYQKRAIQSLHNGQNVFITGKAGTGKSTIIRDFVENTGKNVAILSPTGLAALNVGGQTIHSFFGFPTGFISKSGITTKNQPIIKCADTIVIDEVSMVRADLMDAIDLALQLNCNNKSPFGGRQMVFVGDLAQLSPVLKSDERDIFYRMGYASPYFFDAHVFDNFLPNIVNLEKIHRQDDAVFIVFLNAFRDGTATQDHIRVLNAFAKNRTENVPLLTTTNRRCDEINLAELSKIDRPIHTYNAVISGTFRPTDAPVQPEIHLKVGARVICCANNQTAGYVNGSIGTVVACDRRTIEVKLDSGQSVEVEYYIWESKKYKAKKVRLRGASPIQFDDLLDETENDDLAETELAPDVVGTFRQLPIKLAYAITIHKSQGQTFEEALIDIDRGCFAHGQLYVALSRIKKPHGLGITRPISLNDLKFDPTINRVFSKFASQPIKK